MREFMCLILLGLLVSTGYGAPCNATKVAHQVVLSAASEHCGLANAGILMLGSRSELNTRMLQVIRDEMGISVNRPRYQREVTVALARRYPELKTQPVVIVTEPRIELIPARRLSDNIHCSTKAGCKISYSETRTVSTTHSLQAGISAEAGAKPFGVGVTFTASAHYTFSRSNEESAAFNYEFSLEQGEGGYIADVNAQISAKIRWFGCRRDNCKNTVFDKEVYHESVIMDGKRPRSIISFIHH